MHPLPLPARHRVWRGGPHHRQGEHKGLALSGPWCPEAASGQGQEAQATGQGKAAKGPQRQQGPGAAHTLGALRPLPGGNGS